LQQSPAEKLTDPQLVKKFQHFMESEGSLSHSHAPATCPYPQPVTSSLLVSIQYSHECAHIQPQCSITGRKEATMNTLCYINVCT